MRIPVLTLLLSSLFVAPAVQALDKVTHIGNLDLELVLTNEKGRTDRIVSQAGRVEIAWETRACELTVGNARYACKLDISQDLLSPTGELWIKSMPRLKFPPKAVNQMLFEIGTMDRKTVNVIDRVVRESAPSRSDGFVVPWYVHRGEEEGTRPGQPPQFWNAFAGLWLELPVHAPKTLGENRYYTLRFHFYGLKARRSAFDVVSDNESGNFGN